jgi:hypothetical protein
MRYADERKGKIYEKSMRKNKIQPATAEIYGDSEVEFTLSKPASREMSFEECAGFVA